MDVNEGGMQGFMPHQMLNCKQIRTILIKVGAKSMTERMGGQPVFPSKPCFVLGYPAHNIEGTAGSAFIPLGEKEPVVRPAISKPVFG